MRKIKTERNATPGRNIRFGSNRPKHNSSSALYFKRTRVENKGIIPLKLTSFIFFFVLSALMEVRLCLGRPLRVRTLWCKLTECPDRPSQLEYIHVSFKQHYTWLEYFTSLLLYDFALLSSWYTESIVRFPGIIDILYYFWWTCKVLLILIDRFSQQCQKKAYVDRNSYLHWIS